MDWSPEHRPEKAKAQKQLFKLICSFQAYKPADIAVVLAGDDLRKVEANYNELTSEFHSVELDGRTYKRQLCQTTDLHNIHHGEILTMTPKLITDQLSGIFDLDFCCTYKKAWKGTALTDFVKSLQESKLEYVSLIVTHCICHRAHIKEPETREFLEHTIPDEFEKHGWQVNVHKTIKYQDTNYPMLTCLYCFTRKKTDMKYGAEKLLKLICHGKMTGTELLERLSIPQVREGLDGVEFKVEPMTVEGRDNLKIKSSPKPVFRGNSEASKMYKIVQNNKDLNVYDAAEELGVTVKRASQLLTSLRRRKLIERTGSTRSCVWNAI